MVQSQQPEKHHSYLTAFIQELHILLSLQCSNDKDGVGQKLHPVLIIHMCVQLEFISSKSKELAVGIPSQIRVENFGFYDSDSSVLFQEIGQNNQNENIFVT